MISFLPADWTAVKSKLGIARIFKRDNFSWFFKWTWLPQAIVLLVLAGEMLFVRKHWATNDDIGMSMISQGAGIAAYQSPGLIFSNVIWGWLVIHLPGIPAGMHYSVATYLMLSLAFAATLASLRKAQAPPWTSSLALLLTYGYVLTEPQFTIVAGCLAVAGLSVYVAWRESTRLFPLYIAGALLFLAGIIRLLELLFVVGVVSPFLFALTFPEARKPRINWQALRRPAIFGATMSVLLLGAQLVNSAYYSSTEWRPFREINHARVMFTDYGLIRYFVDYDEMLAGSKVTPNDLRAIGNWFYQDTNVFNEESFSPLLAKVSLLDRVKKNARGYGKLLQNFEDDQFLFLFGFCSLLLLLGLRQNLPGRLAFELLVLCMLVLCLMGRSDLTRIYIAPIGAIIILSLLYAQIKYRPIPEILGCIGMIALIVLFSMNASFKNPKLDYLKAICGATHNKLSVVWGSKSFPYGYLYSPDRAPPACNPVLYPLGSAELAPFALANLQKFTGTQSLVDALQQGQAINIFAQDWQLRILQYYLAEHYSLGLASRMIMDKPHLRLYEIHAIGRLSAAELAKLKAASLSGTGSENDDTDASPQ